MSFVKTQTPYKKKIKKNECRIRTDTAGLGVSPKQEKKRKDPYSAKENFWNAKFL